MCDFEVSVCKANAEISAEQDGCTRMRGTVLRKPPRRRSGIIRGRYFSMRVPTSPLRAMCTKKRKHYVREVGESPKGRGNVALEFQTQNFCSAVH